MTLDEHGLHQPHDSVPGWCPIVKVEAALQALAIDMAVVRTNITEIGRDVGEVKGHQITANTRTSKLEAEAHKAEGALGMFRWLLGVILALMTAGVGLAGVIVARGG